MINVDNAVIMAAGTSSRFAPLSFEKPKSLFEVRGEILIERQIRQLKEAGIKQIILVVGYMKECFEYLRSKYGVILVENNDYLTRNNNGSIFAAKDYLSNSYICSSDNYFSGNPFKSEEESAFYSALYCDGFTNEWCIKANQDGLIERVSIGGRNSWYMFGHTFWDSSFSKRFLSILADEYNNPKTINALWEDIYLRHIDELHMRIKKYPAESIFEFDTLDELREFDASYINDTRSSIIKSICSKIGCLERDIVKIDSFKQSNNSAVGFSFMSRGKKYRYYYETQDMEEIRL